jgi:hypothetical protein
VAAYDRTRSRRQTDPLVAVAAEAAGVASELADSVFEGMTATLRGRRTRSAAGATARRGRAARTRSAGAGAAAPAYAEGTYPPEEGTTADLLVELLGRFGDATREFAGTFADRERYAGQPGYPVLELVAAPGHTAAKEFDFTNTGPTALTEVTFEATDLLGAAATVDASSVSFKHDEGPHIPRVGPGVRAPVIVSVDVGRDIPMGLYRGVIQARSAAPKGRAATHGGPEDAWSLLELEVTGTDRRRPIEPAERPPAEK